MAFCTSCGAANVGRFCAGCGVAADQVALASGVATQVIESAPQAKTVNIQGGMGVNLGGVCGSCGSMRYATGYSFAHLIICIGFFPLGLLSLLAPIKTCRDCRHEFGLGTTLRSLVWFFIIGIIVLICILLGMLHGSH